MPRAEWTPSERHRVFERHVIPELLDYLTGEGVDIRDKERAVTFLGVTGSMKPHNIITGWSLDSTDVLMTIMGMSDDNWFNLVEAHLTKPM